MSARPSHLLLRRRTLLTVPPLLVMLAACDTPTPRPKDGPDDPASELPSDVEPRVLDLAETMYAEAVTACNTLGATVLTHSLTQSPAANAVVCPAGVGMTLALLYAGATELPEKVDQLLGFDATASYPRGLPEERDAAWSAVLTSLLRLDAADTSALADFDPDELPEQPLLHVASRAVLVPPDKEEPGIKVSQAYLDNLRSWYRAQVVQVPRDEAQDSLDAWASWHTGGLIPSSAIKVTENTRLVLQNAILFTAQWMSPFDAEDTYEHSEFHRADGSTSPAELMHQTGEFTMVSGEGWRALRIPYNLSTYELVMDIILPDDVVHPADLPAETWAEATALLEEKQGASQGEVNLALPRLDLSSDTLDILEILADVGIVVDEVPHIGGGLHVDKFAQQVKLRVKEEGTVGAAVTEVEIGVTAVPAPPAEDFICDHPFVLRVVDRASGVCVIEAAVVDPAAD